MTNFIKIASFHRPAEYAVLRLLLEREEIRFFFQNETAISILPFYSPTNGGIFLKVHPNDKEQAIELLNEFLKNENMHLL